MDNILITGAGGFVGKNFCQVLSKAYNVVGIGRKPGEFVTEVCDLCKKNELYKILDNVKPKVIVHCAAYSNVDGAESTPEEAKQNNVIALENLVNWANVNNAKVVFISTDYVYDGVKGNFTEEDKVNPLQYYGQTKVLGEEIVSKLSKFVILRPTVIYGWDEGGKNFFMQLYNNAKTQTPMAIPLDQVSNPTSVSDLSLLIVEVLSKPEISGVFVSTGPEAIGRYDLALRICDYFGLDKSFLIPKTTKEIGRLAPRPLNNSTISAKVQKVYGFNFRSLEENLKEIEECLGNNPSN